VETALLEGCFSSYAQTEDINYSMDASLQHNSNASSNDKVFFLCDLQREIHHDETILNSIRGINTERQVYFCFCFAVQIERFVHSHDRLMR
jgi:hypothetical protein